MLAALIALLAFAPQAAANDDYEHEPMPCAPALEDEAGVSTYEECPPPDSEEPKPDGEEPKPKPKPDVESCDDEAGVSTERHEAKPDDGCLPQFLRGFLTRVWKFIGEVDYYENGEMGMTLGKILNLPRKFRRQDDELLDQDTTVLVSGRARIFENGERVARERLDAANDVRVHGKLLRPGQWREDEDGSSVPTIRAKKVYITG
jgi:hypothetical protein